MVIATLVEFVSALPGVAENAGIIQPLDEPDSCYKICVCYFHRRGC
jgi:hypothetical protein